MQFDSDMDAYECYSNYAAMKGFIVRKKYINRDKDGMITSRWFTCCKESRRQLDEQDKRTRMYSAHTKTGCGARMGISLNRILKKYVVADFVTEHNHELHLQECYHMTTSQRMINEAHGV